MVEPSDRSTAVADMLPRLMRRARRYSPSIDAAEDLTQEALLRVWKRLAEEPPIDDVEAYLFTALKNLSRRRRPPAEELTDDLMPATAPEAGSRLAAGDVMQALAHLPDAQATLILEHAVDGASYAELARRHRLPIGTVMSRVARGRARLRARLDLPEGAPVADLLAGR